MKETYHNLKQLLEMINYSKDSRAIALRYIKRASFKPGEMNVEHPPLAEQHKIIIPHFVAKVKEGVFVGPQIKQLFRDPKFEKLLRSKEKQVWDAFYQVSINFLENDKAENYKDLVEDMLAVFQDFCCNMFLNIHFLNSHLNLFHDNCGQVSDEHVECFHQDIDNMGKLYQGELFTVMLADNCWTLIRDAPHVHFQRRAKRNRKSEAD
ncbi:hypothetical protein AVEN_44899-1 [Araneus ventricosus]|uniref:Uncharacterized protein n=1 Tax=Araneus ventricosus TaxID=182803 RepID=A0A4Y2SKN9_ARAVE|nr:hypothetical protein AVEN_44899-1 [Araneus ventricosus]